MLQSPLFCGLPRRARTSFGACRDPVTGGSLGAALVVQWGPAARQAMLRVLLHTPLLSWNRDWGFLWGLSVRACLVAGSLSCGPSRACGAQSAFWNAKDTSSTFCFGVAEYIPMDRAYPLCATHNTHIIHLGWSATVVSQSH